MTIHIRIKWNCECYIHLYCVSNPDNNQNAATVRYKNRPKMTFDDTALKADQDIELTRDPNGQLEYPIKWVDHKFVQWQGSSHDWKFAFHLQDCSVRLGSSSHVAFSIEFRRGQHTHLLHRFERGILGSKLSWRYHMQLWITAKCLRSQKRCIRFGQT